MERLAYTAVESTLLEAPYLRVGASWKEELLLAGEVLHGVITELTMQSIDVHLHHDPRVDHPDHISDEFADMAERVRAARAGNLSKGKIRLRAWDFKDFNAQHAIAAMWMLHSTFFEAMDRSIKDAAAAGEPAIELHGVIDWLASALLHGTIKWRGLSDALTAVSEMLSGLASGTRLTSETNVFLSVAYDHIVDQALKRIFSFLDVERTNVLRKGDDGRETLQTLGGSSFVFAFLLNRTYRWIGLEGVEAKQSLEMDSDEWLRTVSGPTGTIA